MRRVNARPTFLSLLFAVAVVACKDPSPPSNDGGAQATPTTTTPGTPATTGTTAPDGAPADAAVGAQSDSSVSPGLPPTLGAHALAFQRQSAPGGLAVLSTPAMVTATGGKSTIVVSVGRGVVGAFARPTDNKNPLPYPQLGATHTYTQYPSSGTALYALTGALGGSGHVVSTSTPTDDELTLAAVEVVNGSTVQDFKWNEVAGGNPITSLSVTTTGPATLVAFWWGDAGVAGDKTATPNNGFVVTDSILQSGALVQCAVATKTVSAAGTYNVTWTSTPIQGAQLWLAAVQ
jgi:hypothetical protein